MGGIRTRDQRLQEHQKRSGPVIQDLKAWFTELMDGRKVEPNSGLGGAIEYMQKLCILHRKTARKRS